MAAVGQTQIPLSSSSSSDQHQNSNQELGMSKREANGSIGVTEGSRSKRLRRDADGGFSSDGGDGAMSDNQHSDGEGSGTRNAVKMEMGREEVRRHGLHIWQTVKDAVNKDGRIMSPIFLRKPLKRMYPDYYVLIKQPIALDDIKAKLDKGAYPTLEDVRQDFELCFSNAKQYNLKESEVWRDAKDLLKIVNKTYSKIVPQEGEDKKSKPPSLTRMLKTRLQKLVDKADDHGRYLSTEFMHLPSRKQWPIYYKEIKQPQCFDNIFKKLKQKEYHSAVDFAADVELVFNNAMQFNQEHTQIWEDALALRNLFRQLMSDLPPPHSLSQYPQLSTKIKIKPQATKVEPSHPSLTLRVPAAPVQKPAAVAPLPVAPNKVVPVSQPVAPPPVPAVPAVRSSPRTHQVALPQPIVAPSPLVHSSTPHYLATPNALTARQGLTPPILVPPTGPSTSSILRTSSVQNSTPAIPTPSPAPPSSQHQLKSVKLRVEPRGRLVYLHHTDGVKGWALRMLQGETRLVISDVIFQSAHDDEENDSSDEEDDEEGDYDDDMAVDASPLKGGRKKGKSKKRGRPTRSSTRSTNAKPLKKKSAKPGEVQLKVNGLAIAAQPDQPGEWDVHLPLGPSVLEIGEIGGLIWKVYAERVGTI